MSYYYTNFDEKWVILGLKKEEIWGQNLAFIAQENLDFEKWPNSIVIGVKNGREGGGENGQNSRFSLCPIENGHFWSILGVF